MTFIVDGHGEIEARFIPNAGQPILQRWRLSVRDLSLTAEPEPHSGGVTLTWSSSRGKQAFQKEHVQLALSWLFNKDYLGMSEQDQKELGQVVSKRELGMLQETMASIQSEFGRTPYAFGPIRTNPQRTYDPIRLTPTPESSHVPMLLAELSYPRVKKDWTRLESSLGEFGKRSGLFERINVIRKGKKESDPFQIAVQTGGPSFNLVDVGYGVSQVLPILVDTLQRSRVNDVFLLQQPEVHLHPRAQAELGSYFARQARKNGRFVIETHSDYIVDRIRLEVRRKTLRPEDVSLLYFERRKRGAMVHNLELAGDGSITNPPKGYRQFFLNETDNLLDV
ncbi:MAG TPA: DUF3696 domain-containing protein [Bryobacteraceae bacterium]|nr:DUF3696 domain-containing protein [Bryobacteraceae bacterium]